MRLKPASFSTKDPELGEQTIKSLIAMAWAVREASELAPGERARLTQAAPQRTPTRPRVSTLKSSDCAGGAGVAAPTGKHPF